MKNRWSQRFVYGLTHSYSPLVITVFFFSWDDTFYQWGYFSTYNCYSSGQNPTAKPTVLGIQSQPLCIVLHLSRSHRRWIVAIQRSGGYFIRKDPKNDPRTVPKLFQIDPRTVPLNMLLQDPIPKNHPLSHWVSGWPESWSLATWCFKVSHTERWLVRHPTAWDKPSMKPTSNLWMGSSIF